MNELQRRSDRRRDRVLALALALMIGGCAGSPTVRAQSACTLPVTIRLQAGARINPDSDGTALPTVIRLYELQASARLEEADFASVWEKPTEVLGADLLAARQLTMFPGRADAVQLTLKPEVRFLVAVAIFRRPTATQWRSIIALPDAAAMCAAYEAKGAPQPAVTFRFNQYRAEGRSRLLAAATDHDLPHDVAPDGAPRKKR